MASLPFGHGNATKPPNTGKPPRLAPTTPQPICMYLFDASLASLPPG
jgi:hypothetical protein